jgi:hypothetical protein
MIKRKYIKRAYIEEIICDRCGSIMEPTGIVFPQCSYRCSNKNCCYHTVLTNFNPNEIKYEFYEDDEIPEDTEWDIK